MNKFFCLIIYWALSAPLLTSNQTSLNDNDQSNLDTSVQLPVNINSAQDDKYVKPCLDDYNPYVTIPLAERLQLGMDYISKITDKQICIDTYISNTQPTKSEYTASNSAD